MKTVCFLAGILTGLFLLTGNPCHAEQHRATRLGNPATRFAPPLTTPEDLRSRFRDPKLQPDFAAILAQWGWTGNLDDLFHAAATNEIADITIPVGSTMPFMSSREGGKPVCLRNVLWAGKEPAPAFAFSFVSKGLRYRCVTPKACSNFFLEDLGPEPKPVLAVECDVPARVPIGRSVKVCLTVVNQGNAVEPKTTLTLKIPPGATLANKPERAEAFEDRVTWVIPELSAQKSEQVCAVFQPSRLGALPFYTTAVGSQAATAESSCSTEIFGIPAILLEVVDLTDPIEIGHEVTYEIKITNQGSIAVTNLRLVCALPASLEFASGSGATAVKADGQTVTLEPLATLAPKAMASWQVVAKALKADDARFKVELVGDQFEKPITEDESTQLY